MSGDLQAAVVASLVEFTGLSLQPGPGLLTMSVGELDFDSLELLELVYQLENRFDMRLELETLNEATTLGELVALIARQQ